MLICIVSWGKVIWMRDLAWVVIFIVLPHRHKNRLLIILVTEETATIFIHAPDANTYACLTQHCYKGISIKNSKGYDHILLSALVATNQCFLYTELTFWLSNFHSGMCAVGFTSFWHIFIRNCRKQFVGYTIIQRHRQLLESHYEIMGSFPLVHC